MFRLWKGRSRPTNGREPSGRSPAQEARVGVPHGAEPAVAGSAEGGTPTGEGPGVKRRRFSGLERELLLVEFAASELDARTFAERHGVRPATFSGWLRRQAQKPIDVRVSKRYTPEERRAAVEAFRKSGRRRAEFAKLWGCSTSSLDKWLRRYDAEGPKGLETRPRVVRRPAAAANRLPDSARATIVAVRAEHPEFGAQRIADHLKRFGVLQVSPSTVRNVLRAAGVPAQATPKRKSRRGPKPPRRFERARPGELWQSDITSYVLRRHGRRVYFTVFLDDHSRFIVAWALATHQRTPLVTEPLLEGIARFGKPREVLTDQGRQYYAWRGKSAFQKLLAKEGIAHVVSRAHHPETLGKCERLWKSVADEFWDRAEPQDLDDARRRIGSWVRHYNFFRPHQGIGGLVPADRFFGAESALREALQKELAKNELRLALDEAPRKPVYLTGQIGEERIALHGERGRLVVDTPEGGRRELSMEELGIAKDLKDADSEQQEACDDDGRGTETARNELESGNEAHSAQTDRPQAHGLQGPCAATLAGAGTVGSSAPGGTRSSPRAVHGDPGILAGEEVQGGGGRRSGHDAAASLAAQSDGALGDDGGAVEAAALQGRAGGLRGPDGRADARGPAEAHSRAGNETRAHRGPGACPENGPVDERQHGLDGERSIEPCKQEPAQAQRKEVADREDDAPQRTSDAGSASNCGREATRGRRWKHWLKRRG